MTLYSGGRCVFARTLVRGLTRVLVITTLQRRRRNDGDVLAFPAGPHEPQCAPARPCSTIRRAPGPDIRSGATQNSCCAGVDSTFAGQGLQAKSVQIESRFA